MPDPTRPARAPFTLESDPLPTWRAARAALERWMLAQVLEASNGNLSEAAKLLGITVSAVHYAMRRNGVDAVTTERGERL